MTDKEFEIETLKLAIKEQDNLVEINDKYIQKYLDLIEQTQIEVDKMKVQIRTSLIEKQRLTEKLTELGEI